MLFLFLTACQNDECIHSIATVIISLIQEWIKNYPELSDYILYSIVPKCTAHSWYWHKKDDIVEPYIKIKLVLATFRAFDINEITRPQSQEIKPIWTEISRNPILWNGLYRFLSGTVCDIFIASSHVLTLSKTDSWK